MCRAPQSYSSPLSPHKQTGVSVVLPFKVSFPQVGSLGLEAGLYSRWCKTVTLTDRRRSSRAKHCLIVQEAVIIMAASSMSTHCGCQGLSARKYFGFSETSRVMQPLERLNVVLHRPWSSYKCCTCGGSIRQTQFKTKAGQPKSHRYGLANVRSETSRVSVSTL